MSRRRIMGKKTEYKGGNTLALLHFDGDYTDASGYRNSITPGGSFSSGKFGSCIETRAGVKSVPIIAHNAAFNIGTGDFTIEFWMKANTLNVVYPALISKWRQYDRAYHIQYRTEENCFGLTLSDNVQHNFTYYLDRNWHHVALVRYKSVVNFYVDGTSIGRFSFSGLLDSASSPIGIGDNMDTGAGNGQIFDGRIDEFRFSNVARWTSNFTPSNQPYTSD